MITLEKYLQDLSDQRLIEMYLEVQSGSVPLDGPTHTLRRQINDMIDSGDMLVQRSFARLYLKSFVNAINKEMANRYVLVCMTD